MRLLQKYFCANNRLIIKKQIFLFLSLTILNNLAFSQPIHSRSSQDTLFTSDSLSHIIYYYKPTTYDSINSPLLFGIHQLYGNGDQARSVLIGIAEKRKALIVAPTFPDGGFTAVMTLWYNHKWLVPVIKRNIQACLGA